MSLVFDSSALLALLLNESGAEAVSELLEDADVPKFAHAVNMCEVFYRIAVADSNAAANEALESLNLLGIKTRDDMDRSFWHDIAMLVTDRRREGQPLALGDAFGVALARREDADFVTADRAELEAVRASGAARVTFIR